MARRRGKILSERELEVMIAVWKLGRGTVKEIRMAMGGDKAGAYTSVATMLKFLETKGIVRHEQDGRTFYYIPRTSKEAEQRKALDFVLSNYFGGDVDSLLQMLKSSSQIDRNERTMVSNVLTIGHP